MIRCITIDDEPHALRQMVDYVNKTPFLELAEKFENPLLALSYLQENPVDLIFIDINMPDLNGMDFVKSLQNPPKVIFTTAYSEYAVEGFKVNAVDYLLKPISYNDFLKAATKVQERLNVSNETVEDIQSNDDFLFIKSEYKILRINFSDIRYVESMQEYLRIHLENETPIMALMSMKKLESFLPITQFMRVHRSYIVNLSKITRIERNRIVFDNKVYIPISDQYKDQFQEFLNKNFLV
ncbi:MAG: LytTR family DNA-binding domain-containing protein [Paludibacter sp.]|nr:LytTR family DNA-binding domain-containing protein [Paludibacter sp.]